MENMDMIEVVSIGSDDEVLGNPRPENEVTIMEQDFQPASPDEDHDGISDPSPGAKASPAAGFLILSWRSPLTPSHVSNGVIFVPCVINSKL